MNEKKRLASVVLATAAIVGLSIGQARAQNFDHLECYKMKDSHKFSAIVNLKALQDPLFPVQDGCRVAVKGREFCVPVEKTRQPGGDAPSAPVAGHVLENDFICYKVKCPKPVTPIPGVLVSDQFGSRNLERFTAKKLCVPTIKGLPTTTTTTTTTTSTTSTSTTTTVPMSSSESCTTGGAPCGDCGPTYVCGPHAGGSLPPYLCVPSDYPPTVGCSNDGDCGAGEGCVGFGITAPRCYPVCP